MKNLFTLLGLILAYPLAVHIVSCGQRADDDETDPVMYF